MQLAGLQRCSLVDYPGQACSTVFTQGCNLRCPWCHNGELIGTHARAPLPESELWQHLEQRRGKVNAVTVTGGEPTEHTDLPELLKHLKVKGHYVKLDTNGTHPAVLEKLIQENLVDVIAMDVKAPLDKRYAEVVSCAVDLDALRASIVLIKESPLAHIFRTTVVPLYHDPDTVESIAQLIAGAQVYHLQAFRPSHARTVALRSSPGATPALMEDCRQRASRWVKSKLR